MRTYIGLANCSRCGGNSPNCYVCNDPNQEEKSEPASEESFIRSCSDEELNVKANHENPLPNPTR